MGTLPPSANMTCGFRRSIVLLMRLSKMLIAYPFVPKRGYIDPDARTEFRGNRKETQYVRDNVGKDLW